MNSASDQVWNEQTNSYNSVASQLPVYKVFDTDWFPATSSQPATNYQMVPFYKEFLTGPDMILILGAGIQYGMPAADGSIQPVPYAGAARILICV